jgi:hypothetical protein
VHSGGAGISFTETAPHPIQIVVCITIQKLREQIKEMMAKFAHAAMLVQRWDFEFENQQYDDNREDPVAECLNPGEAQFALRNALQ